VNDDSPTTTGCHRCGRPVAVAGTLCDVCREEAVRAILQGAEAATVLGIPGAPARPADPGDTMLSAPAVPEPDTTVLSTPAAADADRTVLSPPRGAGDQDATVLSSPGKPPEDDATVLSSPGKPPEHDATVLASGPHVDHDATRLTPADSRPAQARGGPEGPLTVGDSFGRYAIMKLLGAGGMGAVYQAWDTELEVVVALKVIRPEVLRDPIAAEEIERRFKRELLLARQVTHKNVVRIYDLGEIDGIKYITMSYLDGKELGRLLKEGALAIPDILRIMRSVASGLAAAHKAGVIHRDLKPANIMIGKDGEALIMDFGIARSANADADSQLPVGQLVPSGLGQGTGTGKLTHATVLGSVVGTVEYMAPEQARGETIDHRADIFTFGLILYDMLAGARRPGSHLPIMEQLNARMTGVIAPIKSVAPQVPDALAAVVTRTIEPDPANRYQTTEELAAALDALDDNGIPKPVKRVVRLPVAVAAAVLLIGGPVALWYGYLKPPPPLPGNTTVVIADFDNRTGDAAFNRTLEPNLRRALEGAGFITAYDRVGLLRTVGVKPTDLPATLDEKSARELAAKQGLNLVLSGAIEKQGSRYQITMKVTQAVEDRVVADVSARAASVDDVIPAATRLIGEVREELGDRTTETDPLFAKRSLSASSVEVLRYYAAAQNASASNKWPEAQEHLLKAIEVDPNFGLGYLLLSGVSRNLGNPQAANDYVKQAMSHLDGMTNRERMTTRGMFFRLSGDYKQCLQEQEDLIKAYSADIVGRNQLAVCAGQLRDFGKARETMAEVVKLLPNRTLFRNNLGFFNLYLSDFAEAEAQARIVQQQDEATRPNEPKDPFAFLILGMSVLAQERPKEAIEAFTSAAKARLPGPTFSASGLGDVAVYEGRYSDAIRITEQGAAADVAAKSPDRAAGKLLHQAYANLRKDQKPAAVASAQRALALSQAVKVRFLAARIFLEAGQAKLAAPLAAALLAAPQPEPQAYGKLLQSITARMANDHSAAIKAAEEANATFDTWLGHFDLGRAYLQARQFPQADSEFDRCVTRRGEAVLLFLDEEPTYGYFPMVYFYQGLVREGMNLDAKDKFRAYLKIREAAGEDPLIADLRRRTSK
jgi:serine/threonine protein kinase/tetratricopeptide (TPR) repeat protein